MPTRERPDAPFGVWVACRQCLCCGPIANTEADAIAAWNALSRAAKRGMRAKGGRTAAVLAAARELVGKPVYIEWADDADWHWYDLLAAEGVGLHLRGLASPDRRPWLGEPWWVSACKVKSIRALRDGEA